MATIQQTQNFPPNYDGTMVAVPPPPVPPPGRNPYARRTGGIPLPPAQPANDPNMLQTDVPADPLSPTTLVLNYLKSRGYQPTAENIRRTVEANARDPSVLGADPVAGLRNARASTDAEDLAAMRAAGVGGAGGGRGGGGPPLPVPPIPPTDDKNTSSAPPAASGWRGPFSGPPDPTNTLTTDVDQAARLALRNPPGPEYGLTSDYTRPPLPGPWGGGGGGGGPPPTTPPPTDPVGDSVTKALEGPPEQLRLPPPPTRPAIAAPPEVPALPPPAPQMALPPPPDVPMPNVVGQSARPPITTSTTLRGSGSTATPPGPKIAPGNRIQGAPIQPGPIAGPLGRGVVGGIRGAGQGYRMGGPYGAAAGGLAGAAPGLKELVDNILAGRVM